ncbi:nucleoside diphosphate kinase [Elysia marginata]|uniref:Nucleoside diphosphate kinase n=1 Tax=Elysia marginata TaxID=1093978 RepID=A0AAV4FT73_9GAST|nr:nucleoside diphosphate kinase [Elysia marginata]
MSQRLQLTLAILKPDIVANPSVLKNVWTRMLENGLYFVMSKRVQLSAVQAEQFYAEHRGKFFQNRLVCFMSSGPVWCHILCGDDVIGRWRRMLGPTKVLKTVFDQPDSIRGSFGLTDTRNCAHGSDADATAKKEVGFFFPEFDIDKWYKEQHKFFQNDLVEFDPDKLQHFAISDT